jgi:hypothetical protein
MGQYWLPVNLDKKEFIDPHKLASGLKLWEQIANDFVGKALIVLTAAMPDARGGGDLKPDPRVGRWAGDRIAIVGDYAENGDLAAEHQAGQIYGWCRDGVFTDVTDGICEVLEHELNGKFTGTGWRDWKENP